MRYTRQMALDSKPARVAAAGGTRLDSLRAVLASAVPDADPSDIHAASEYMDEVLSGAAPSPGWDRSLFPGWQNAPDGVRLARRAIRVALHRYQLPVDGDAFDLAYEFAQRRY